MRKLVGTALLLSSAALAQEEVKQLREEVEVLKEELRRLRLEISMPQITTYQSYTGLGPAASKALINPKGVSIGGYGEVWFTAFPQKSEKFEADLFRFIVYLGYAFTEKLKFNSEIEIEHAKVEGGEEGGEVAIEFAFIDYRVNKYLGLRGGMVLVPLGITNEYHEPPTYLSVRQPYLEKKLFPFTWRENGVGFYGETDLVEYRAYLINGMKVGDSYDPDEPLDSITQDGSQAIGDSPAFTGRFDLKLPKNLKVGVATFLSPVFDSNGGRLGSVSILSPHLWWQYAGFDVRFVGAYTTVDNSERITQAVRTSTGDPTYVFPKRMQGFYFQVAYNVLRFFDTEQELFIFGKVEDVQRYAEVPSGETRPDGGNLKILNFGVSYRPHPLVALKADYAREDYSGNRQDMDVYSAAITWMF